MPQWDGNNYYRSPTANQADLSFFTTLPSFFELTWQPYSPTADFRLTVLIDGKAGRVEEYTHGKFTISNASQAFGAGFHTLSLKTDCLPSACDEIRFYHLQARSVPTPTPYSQVGIDGSFVNLLAPDKDTAVRVNDGLSQVEFDGNNLMRRLSSAGTVQFKGQGKVTLFTFRIYSEKKGSVRVQVGDKIGLTAVVPANTFLPLYLNLRGQSGDIRIIPECQPSQNTTGCDFRIYDPLLYITRQAPYQSLQIVASLILILCIFFPVVRFFRLRR